MNTGIIGPLYSGGEIGAQEYRLRLQQGEIDERMAMAIYEEAQAKKLQVQADAEFEKRAHEYRMAELQYTNGRHVARIVAFVVIVVAALICFNFG